MEPASSLAGWSGPTPHIPVWEKAQRDYGTFSRSAFTFNKQKNEYRCPNGKVLRTTGRVHDGRASSVGRASIDAGDRVESDRRLGEPRQVEELAPRMGPARRLDDWPGLARQVVEPIEAGIGIGLASVRSKRPGVPTGAGNATGTNAGFASAALAGLNSRRQRNNGLVARLCLRATADTKARSTPHCATIACFSGHVQRRRASATITNGFPSELSPDIGTA